MAIVVQVVAFSMLIITIALMLYCRQRALGGKVPNLRKFPALDAIDESIGLAAEKGKPIWNPFSQGSADDPQGSSGVVITLSALMYSCKIAAKKGVKILTGTVKTQMIPFVYEVMRDGYSESPELFDESSIRFTVSGLAWIAYNATLHATEKPASQIMIGSWWGETPVILEIAKRAGCFMIGGTDYTENNAFMVMYCDYSLVFEEIYVTGAYLSGDPIQKSTILAEDLMKFIIIGISIVCAVANLVGFPTIVGLLKI